MKAPLTALVIAQNEEAAIGECLRSLAWAAEILVVDGGSRDRTVELATAAGARVLHRPFDTPARQRNWALPQAGHPWILVADADERVRPELAREIAELLRDGPAARGYRMRRETRFLGRTMRHSGWQHDWVLRLFPRDGGRYEDRRVHESAIVPGPTARLRGVIEHESYTSLGQYLEKSRRYALWGAQDLAARGRPPRLADLLLRPPGRFLKMYVAQSGWRDGVEGLLLAGLTAAGVFAKYAEHWRLWEESRAAAAEPW